jgi:hypothetical protein
MTSGLPVKDIDHCTCWENIQYAFLCMTDEHFELFLLTDEEVKQNKLKHQKAQQPVKKPTQKVVTGDKYLDEIEKAFEKGDMTDVDALLKNL